ncbi:PAS domain-containing sensor histidine kinase [Bacteroidota bacterium]
MIFKSYKFNIAIRLLLILINSIALSYYLVNTGWYIIIINLTLLLLMQIFLIYRYLTKISADLTNFFNSLKQNDFGIKWDDSKNEKLFGEVYKCLNLLNKSVREINIEKEHQGHYFNILAEHVSIGLIIFDKKGNVELFNNAAKNLMGLNYLNNISSLNKILPEFSNIMVDTGPSDQKVITININKEIKQILVLAAEFKISGQKKKLISIQNIKDELDEKEIVSWQKLSRVLTHEIMNSIAPINSTIKEIARMLKNSDLIKNDQDPHDINVLVKTVEGLEIIEERSNGLIDFVSAYRKINSVPEPEVTTLDVGSLLMGIAKLMDEEIRKKNINFKVEVKEKIMLEADHKQVQQILLNLIKNSIQALENTKDKIIILRSFYSKDNKCIIEVEDKGCGIPENKIDQIFIPFYTTRENGSGIGLSLSRQIMLLHGGSISVKSEEEKGSIFTLRFRI